MYELVTIHRHSSGIVIERYWYEHDFARIRNGLNQAVVTIALRQVMYGGLADCVLAMEREWVERHRDDSLEESKQCQAERTLNSIEPL